MIMLHIPGWEYCRPLGSAGSSNRLGCDVLRLPRCLLRLRASCGQICIACISRFFLRGWKSSSCLRRLLLPAGFTHTGSNSRSDGGLIPCSLTAFADGLRSMAAVASYDAGGSRRSAMTARSTASESGEEVRRAVPLNRPVMPREMVTRK